MNFSSAATSLWDISQTPSQFSQLPDDDFLALLQKQFPTTDNTDHSVNPHGLHTRRPSSNSDDSSPSPPGNTDDTSRRHSPNARLNDTDDAPLKRKASSDSMDPGPSTKNQHTGSSHSLLISTSSSSPPADDSNPAKKSQPSRRKSTGNPHVSPSINPAHCPSSSPQHDESRLLKRKEQNRAAQRAFRERKEKHVKDVSLTYAAPCLTCLISPSWRTRWQPSKRKTKRQKLKTRTCAISYPASRRKTWR